MAKRVSFYSILAALCIVLGYVERLIPLDFIAPGIKLGLANALTLTLVVKGDIKGAFAVNIVRILLSALLFASPSVLIYSLTAGITSLTAVSLLAYIKKVGVVGISVFGAVIHNLTQLAVAYLIVGAGVLYYLPFLLVSALVCGMITALPANILLKNFKV